MDLPTTSWVHWAVKFNLCMQDTTSLTSFLKFMHSSSKPFYGVLCLQALFHSLLFTLRHQAINSKLRVSSLKATQKYPSSKPPQRRPSHRHRVTKQEKSKPTQRKKRAQRAFLCTVPKAKARSPIFCHLEGKPEGAASVITSY